MTSIKDTKKHASRIYLKDSNDKTVVYLPLKKEWRNGSMHSMNRYITFTIDGENRIFDTQTGEWHDQYHGLLPTLTQQKIYGLMRHVIEESNHSIKRLRNPQRRNLVTHILKKMHHY